MNEELLMNDALLLNSERKSISDGTAELQNLKDRSLEYHNFVEKTLLDLRQKVIELVKDTYRKNRHPDFPIYQFKIELKHQYDSNDAIVNYSIDIEGDRNTSFEKFISFSSLRMTRMEKEKIGMERINVALKLKKSVVGLFSDPFLQDLILQKGNFEQIKISLPRYISKKIVS